MKISKTTATTRIVVILLILFLLTMVTSQVYMHFSNPFKTETAIPYSTSTSITFKGVCVRNETLIPYNGNGIINYIHPDGSKLAKNSVLAQVFKTEHDISIKNEIDRLNDQISILKEAQNFVGTDNSQLEAFTNQITEIMAIIQDCIRKGDYARAQEMKKTYLNLLSKKQIVQGKYTDYSDKIEQLEARVLTLKSKISAAADELSVDSTGYFVSVVDGYENELSVDMIKSITASQIQEIIKNPVKTVTGSYLGKMIDGYEWRFVAVLDSTETKVLFNGATVKMFVGSQAGEITAVVENVLRLDDGKSVFTFRCDRLREDFVQSRVLQFRLILEDFKGIRIPAQALRFDEENNPGVFIKYGDQILFKKVNIIKAEQDFILLENTTTTAGYISMYDTVVVEGKDLYDGKTLF